MFAKFSFPEWIRCEISHLPLPDDYHLSPFFSQHNICQLPSDIEVCSIHLKYQKIKFILDLKHVPTEIIKVFCCTENN